MFSRRTPTHRRIASWGHEVTRARYDTPLDELVASLDRVEELVKKARKEEEGSPLNTSTATTTPPRESMGFSAAFRSGRKMMRKQLSAEELKTPERKTNFLGRKEREAKFLLMTSHEEAEMVELLRRIAELVVLGEKAVAAAEVREDRRRRHRRQQSEGSIPRPESFSSQEGDTESHAALFEHFFERNALSLIVNIATGVAYTESLEASPSSDDGSAATGSAGGKEGDESVKTDKSEPPQAPKSDCTLLPSLPIATQAVQSVSILIQNVSRATSLYFLLSNNHINELIDLPLDLYSIAEKGLRDLGDTPTPKRTASPEIAELTTHFVSFLKSLAMRMNAETLQFFLTYPAENAGEGSASSKHFSAPDASPQIATYSHRKHDDGPMDEAKSYREQPVVVNQPVPVETVKVEFPLYRRALDFCAAHQDSFVRVTAMNICLNTLRLATVSPGGADDGIESKESFGSSPDGVLHNAQPLPLRERLAIAQHVCAPLRVAGLVSPIFTKLAELWGMLEEHFREMDSIKEGSAARGSGDDLSGRRRTAKVEKARDETRRRRVVDNFHDAAASIQDELLMLEDVFKVGLTSLNEQTIEMMMATFVYPLLLQPLLMYMQTVPAADDSSTRYGMFREGSDSLSAELTEQGGTLGRSHEAAPAKTAFFSLASVFHFISNRPLMRLLLTALLHPLAPDASAETVIRANPDVACKAPNGKLAVRVDEGISDPTALIGDERRFSYSFGEVTGQKRRINDSVDDSSRCSRNEEDICVFVLSPALAYVLEGKAGNLSTIVKTRTNPYRRSILQCLVSNSVSTHMRQLSMMTIDAAASKFDSKFLGDLVFGSGMRTFGDEMPMDERRLDTRNAYTATNRDIGFGNSLDSRRAFKRAPGSQGGRVDSNPTVDVVAPLCLSVLTTSSNSNESWNIGFDGIAAHALLCLVRSNVRAMESAAKMLDRRKRQAAAFLAEVPTRVDSSEVQSTFLKAATIEKEDEMRIGMAMDHMIYDPVREKGMSIIEELLMRFKDRGKLSVDEDYSVAIALESSFNDLSDRACVVSKGPQSYDDETSIGAAANCALTLLQLDALARLMQELAATNGRMLRDRKMVGFAISGTGSMIDTTNFREEYTGRSIYAPISRSMFSDLFDRDVEVDQQPSTGEVVKLAGHAAFPCVCEVPDVSAALFADTEASLVAAGVKWQSLYLVFLDRYMLLAEPEKEGSGGNGRVVTSCELAQVRVEKDPIPSSGSASPARRLLISHIGYDSKPPGLFVLAEKPVEKFLGPFVHLQVFHSFLDVWFEDGHVADQAYNVMACKIAEAKSKRGNRLRTKYSN